MNESTENAKYYTITDVAKITNLKAYQIRNIEKYLDLFFARDTTGNRYFTEKDVELLRVVKEARDSNLMRL